MRRVPRSSIAMAPLASMSLLFTTAAALVAPRAAVRRTRLMAEPPIGDLADRRTGLQVPTDQQTDPDQKHRDPHHEGSGDLDGKT